MADAPKERFPREGFFAKRRLVNSQPCFSVDKGPANLPKRSPDLAHVPCSTRLKFKAHSLIDKVYHMSNLKIAWAAVKRNKGAHGIDRVTLRMFEDDKELRLREIQRKLVQHRYIPLSVRRVYIPKPNDSKARRPLGGFSAGRLTPVVPDRVVQQALLQVVEPLFDASMSERSFGYRKGRNAHDAIATLIRDAKEGYCYVLDADIKAFFDSIDHNVVMLRVRLPVNITWADGRVLDLIEAFLKAGVCTVLCFDGGRSRHRLH